MFCVRFADWRQIKNSPGHKVRGVFLEKELIESEIIVVVNVGPFTVERVDGVLFLSGY